MKRKIHIEAVKKAIDSMFRERIPKNLILKNERKVVWVTQGIGTIDTRSETELSSLFETMFEAYQHKHPDNTRELFIEAEIDRAKEYQTYFPEYKTNSEHKTYYFELQRWIDFLNKVAKPTGELQQTPTKTEILKAELGKYGFFELSKVKQLSEQSKQNLIDLISTKGLPYSIAMFEYLGFLKHIENEHFITKYKLNKEVAKWFNSDKDGRAVKGNISSLSDHSSENKSKYTAHTHKETVKTDYQKLK